MENTGNVMKKDNHNEITGKLFLLVNTARRDMEKWTRAWDQKTKRSNN